MRLIQVEVLNNILHDAFFEPFYLRKGLQESLILLLDYMSQFFVLFTDGILLLELL